MPLQAVWKNLLLNYIHSSNTDLENLLSFKIQNYLSLQLCCYLPFLSFPICRHLHLWFIDRSTVFFITFCIFLFIMNIKFCLKDFTFNITSPRIKKFLQKYFSETHVSSTSLHTRVGFWAQKSLLLSICSLLQLKTTWICLQKESIKNTASKSLQEIL